ncbi:MAG: 3-dehydroquinate synthase [Rhodospirillaceae bacterium]|nr:3-dehydroquinate synthase [Rhodospirillaceae bacterium]
MSGFTKVSVHPDGGAYEILVGADIIRASGQQIANVLGQRRIFVITDENIANLYKTQLEGSLTGAGHEVTTVVVAPGEGSKDFSSLEQVLGDLLRQGITRNCVIVAFGGGVVGDLAGFAASIILRGIDYVQIPTTLLSQVDSSVGGKTAVNTNLGKNLVGTFYQPKLVLVDPGLLKSLPLRELRAGYGEVIKYGLLSDAPLFEWLEVNGGDVLRVDAEACRYVITECCQIKAEIVSNDEREKNSRMLLNLGHTFGHAMEADLGYDNRLLHGEAVAIGSIIALETSARLGFCEAAVPVRVRRHFQSLGLPVSPPKLKDHRWVPENLLKHMARDKKVVGGKQILILVRSIGNAFVYEEATREILAQSWEERLGGG